jgi:drug/metabolite transporter (DMT)-like permease
MHEPTTGPSAALGNVLIALLCLIWGSTWMVIQRGLADLPPFTSAAARFVLAAIAMSVVVPLFRRRESGREPELWLCAVVGVCNFGVSYGIVYWSETRIPSGLASVLWSIFPMLMAASGHLFLPGETLRGRQWLGFVVGFVGVAFLFETALRASGLDAAPAGLVMCLSPLVSAIGTTVLKRHGSGIRSMTLNRNAMWIGAALLCTAAAVLENGRSARWNATSAGSVIYLAFVGTALTFGLYFWLLRHLPAHKLSLISYVTPAIALMLGTFVGKEPFTAFTGIGSALILAGVCLVVHRPTPRSAEPVSATSVRNARS